MLHFYECLKFERTYRTVIFFQQFLNFYDRLLYSFLMNIVSTGLVKIIFSKNRKYVITRRQEKAVIQVLSHNKLFLMEGHFYLHSWIEALNISMDIYFVFRVLLNKIFCTFSLWSLYLKCYMVMESECISDFVSFKGSRR